MVPQPVTTPSPAGLLFSMPKSVQRWAMNMSNSSKLVLVQQQLDPFAGPSALPRPVLCVDAALAAAQPRVLAAVFQLGKKCLSWLMSPCQFQRDHILRCAAKPKDIIAKFANRLHTRAAKLKISKLNQPQTAAPQCT